MANRHARTTAKRKGSLPDPSKINPLLLKRASEVTQKLTSKNVNKNEVAEAVTREVDLPSLSIKGQPTSHAPVSGSTFRCSVDHVTGNLAAPAAAQTKGSVRGTDSSLAQFIRHNPDDVMEVVPEDYGSPELVQLLNLVRQSLPIEERSRFLRRRCAGGAIALDFRPS